MPPPSACPLTGNILMRRALIILFSIALLCIGGALPSPISAQKWGNNNWQLQQQQQQMQRQQEMQRQQQRQQEMMRQQQQMRQQQEMMRQQQQRQQQLMRERQQQMQRQMQERQQQAAQQRQQMADRQRQMQQQQDQQRSQRHQQEQQRVQGQQQQVKQQQAVQQRQMLQQQRQVKDRQERLNRLQQERLRRQQSEQKKEAASIATMAAQLGRTKLGTMPLASRPATKSASLTQFQQGRIQQQARQRMTKVLEAQRKAVKVALKRMRDLQSRMALKRQMVARQQQKKADTLKLAERNFNVSCVGHGCTCSFHGDTRVLTKDGYEPIKSLVVGKDSVWARDESTGKMDWKPITARYSNPYNETVRVSIRTADGQGQSILSNRIHPFYVTPPVSSHMPKGQWVQAQHLHPGDQLLTDSGHSVEVLGLEIKDEPLEAYNITVEDFHTYYVRGASNEGASSVLVHNSCHDKEKAWEVPEVVRAKFPLHWTSRLNKKAKRKPNKQGIVWEDPNDQGNGVRIDKGNPNHQYATQRVDHVIVRSGGTVRGRDGKPIMGKIKDDHDNAHIPLEEYQRWKSWDSP